MKHPKMYFIVEYNLEYTEWQVLAGVTDAERAITIVKTSQSSDKHIVLFESDTVIVLHEN